MSKPGFCRQHLAGMRLAIMRVLAMSVALASAAMAQPVPATAESVAIAVATNFVEPARALTEKFTQETGHAVTISTGATGTLYAQIVAGAPFDVLLAADAERPMLLEKDGLAVAGTRRTYALGRLVLWSASGSCGNEDDARRILTASDYRALAIADPKLAPYGVAAREVLKALGAWQSAAPRIVHGANIGQSYAHVATGNAEVGLIALSQMKAAESPGTTPRGTAWLVPQHLHAPIRQDAILLTPAREKAAARMFLDFLASAPAHQIIRHYGYELAP